MALKIRGNSQILTGSVHNAQLKDADISLSKLDGNGGTLGGDITLSGATTLGSTLAVSGAATLSSTLEVDGATTLSSSLGVASDLKVNTDKFVVTASNGNTDVAGTLGVTGAAYLNSTLDVSGPTTLSSSLDVASDLEVSGNTDVAGTLGVTGDATVGGNLTVTGDLTVDGTQTFLNTSTLEVEDKNIVVAKGSNDSLAADGGGLTIQGPDAQLTWDHNSGSGRFKMNKDLYVTGEIEGSSLTDGVATMSSGSLTNVVDVTASGIVSFGTLTDIGESIAISKFVDEADGISSNDNDISIPTSAAVKNYVDVKVASGGYSSAKLGDYYLYSLSYSTFIPARLNTILITVDVNNSLHDTSNQQIEMASSEFPVYSEFEFLTEVFLNGQKLRYDAYSGSSFSNGDFTIINNGSSSNRLIKFNSNVISDEDDLEIKYYSISHVMELNDLDYDGIIGLNDSNDIEILSSNLGIAATSGITADPNGSDAPYFTSGTYVDDSGNTKSSTFFNYIYMHSSWSDAMGLSPAYPDVEVGNIETIYVVATVDEAPSQDSLHMGYYTVAEGDGQDASWYRSRITFLPTDSPQFTRGVKTLFWYGQEPAADLHPDLPRVEMILSTTSPAVGPQGSSEKLLGLSVSTSTANTDGSVKIVFEKAGMISSEFTFEKEYKYSA